jgi:tetratricopeptide (TPR) repeat protein
MALLTVAAGGGLDRLWSALRTRRWLDPPVGLILAGLALVWSVGSDWTFVTSNKVKADPFSWHTLANSYAAAGQLDRAQQAYQRAVAINRIHPQPYFVWIEESVYTGLADILLQQGRLADAVGVYQEWVRSSPENVAARIHLGELLLQSGRVDEAAAHFEIALRNDPDHFAAQLGQAWILYHNGDFGAALRRFESLRRRQPDVQVQFGAGLCLIQLQRWAEAEQIFQEVLSRQPDYWQAWGNLAGLYEQTGRLAKARQAYEQLLRLRPQDEKARTWLREHPR